MSRSKPGMKQSPCDNKNNQSGFMMILSVIIMTSVITVIVVRTTLSSLTRIETRGVGLISGKIAYLSQSCLDEALISLNRDNSYIGTTFSLDAGDCDIVVSGSGNTRTIDITATIDNYSQDIQADVTLDPFGVDSWE